MTEKEEDAARQQSLIEQLATILGTRPRSRRATWLPDGYGMVWMVVRPDGLTVELERATVTAEMAVEVAKVLAAGSVTKAFVAQAAQVASEQVRIALDQEVT